MPEKQTPVRNIWSGNMSVRKEVFQSIGGFRAGFGKIGNQSRPEDTDFCIRAAQRWPGQVWLYNPAARVRHKVPANRAGWNYFITRCYAEGLGKADLARLVGAKDGLSAESQYLISTLPAGVFHGIATAIVRRDPMALTRSGAIVAGLFVTGVGYIKGVTMRLRLPKSMPFRHGNAD
jgi:hypothetical protein